MKRLLLVEDDAYSAQSLAEQLAEHFEVLAARNGDDGLHEAKSAHPDLILLDIILPGKINGFDVLRELKNTSTTKHIPVIMLTNLDDQKAAALEFGAEDCLIKANSTFDEIMKAIQKAFAKSLEAQQN